MLQHGRPSSVAVCLVGLLPVKSDSLRAELFLVSPPGRRRRPKERIQEASIEGEASLELFLADGCIGWIRPGGGRRVHANASAPSRQERDAWRVGRRGWSVEGTALSDPDPCNLVKSVDESSLSSCST